MTAVARTEIRLEVRKRIARVTLDGPPRNEMGIAFFESLAAFTETELKNLDVHGLILEGRGRHFSSGANVPEIETLGAESDGRVASLLTDNIRSFLTISNLPYPTAAVVRGCCLGAGMELALACRFRVAEPNAVFALPEVTWGIMPGCGGTVRLPRLVGRAVAAELILSGRSVLADEAVDLGIADAPAERNRGVDVAIELFRRAGESQ